MAAPFFLLKRGDVLTGKAKRIRVLHRHSILERIDCVDSKLPNGRMKRGWIKIIQHYFSCAM